jgi:methionyl-tRNA formyltransferase
MTKTSKTVVFFGNERLATAVTTTAPTLHALIEAGYRVPAVVSSHKTADSRSVRSLEIQKVADEYAIPLLTPRKVQTIAHELQAFQPDIGVLVAYGQIIPQAILDVFPLGIINIHPSLLPAHRGPTPVENAILTGEKHTGVSIMQLTKEMDAGPVFDQTSVILSGQETKQELAEKLLLLGSQRLTTLLPDILSQRLKAIPQDDSQATYDRLINKSDGQIDWAKPAVTLEREIRAYLDWPGSYTQLGGKTVTITAAQVVNKAGAPGTRELTKKSLLIYCGTEALQIKQLKPADKQEMPVEAFLNGYRSLLN